jgi:hypothetical protein
MAAVTVASGPVNNVIGNKRRVSAVLTAPADGDTWATGLTAIDDVQISFPAGNLAAADSVSHTVSGGTVTFKVVGTARNLNVVVTGY